MRTRTYFFDERSQIPWPSTLFLLEGLLVVDEVLVDLVVG